MGGRRQERKTNGIPQKTRVSLTPLFRQTVRENSVAWQAAGYEGAARNGGQWQERKTNGTPQTATGRNRDSLPPLGDICPTKKSPFHTLSPHNTNDGETRDGQRKTETAGGGRRGRTKADGGIVVGSSQKKQSFTIVLPLSERRARELRGMAGGAGELRGMAGGGL